MLGGMVPGGPSSGGPAMAGWGPATPGKRGKALGPGEKGCNNGGRPAGLGGEGESTRDALEAGPSLPATPTSAVTGFRFLSLRDFDSCGKI